MEPTINTFHPDYGDSPTPSRERCERTREQFQKDNKPTEDTHNNGLSFVKPMQPNAYRPFEGMIGGYYD